MEKEKGGSLALAGSVEMGGAACNKKYSHVLIHCNVLYNSLKFVKS